MITDSYYNMQKELNILQTRVKAIEDTKEDLSLEKENIQNRIVKLKENIVEVETNLKGLKGIEQELYYEMVVNRLTPTQAIDRLSYRYDKDVSTFWKVYYPKVKEKIQIFKEVPVKFQ